MSLKDKLTAAVYVVLIAALAAVLLLKPTVDNDFHAEYQRNLERLESEAGVLQREHRNVLLGITRHYDFLEAAMQELEKGSKLVALHPGFVDADYSALVEHEMASYRDRLAAMRVEVDATKRLTGLLRNSRNSIDLLIRRIASDFEAAGQVPVALFELQRASATAKLDAVPDLAWLDGSPHRAQLQLHLDVVRKLAPLNERATAELQKLIAEATEPGTIRNAYLDQYYAAVRSTQQSMLASYGVAGLLLVLSVLQVRQARRARRDSDRARFESEQSRADSELARADAEKQRREAELARSESESMAQRVAAQLDETRAAVAACNEVLQALAEGKTGQRVTREFDGDLGELCRGVNLAVGCVEETLGEIERVMHAIRDGRLDVQVDAALRGRVRDSVAEAMSFLDQTFNGIRQAIDNMAQGQFSARVDVVARGDLARLKDAINESMAALEGAIESINTVVVAQSNGDLSQRIAREFPGDLGVLARAVNRSAEMLSEMMNEARDVAIAVRSAAAQVNQSAGSVTEAAQSQLRALQSTREGTHAVSDGITHSSRSLVAAGELAGEAKQRAGEGEIVLDKARQSMNSIIESSRKIENIVGLIESIAFQTNLLALNAAVEAARAQEHGRGFAVVAGEVRVLAQQSAEASSSIKKLIQASVEEVQRGAQDVHATGEAFEAISTVVERVNAIFEEMKSSSQAQEASMQRVNGHVRDLDQLSQRNLSLAENNNESAAALADNAERMQAVIARFATEPAAPVLALAARRRAG